jgi:hypothetical protein
MHFGVYFSLYHTGYTIVLDMGFVIFIFVGWGLDWKAIA